MVHTEVTRVHTSPDTTDGKVSRVDHLETSRVRHGSDYRVSHMIVSLVPIDVDIKLSTSDGL